MCPEVDEYKMYYAQSLFKAGGARSMGWIDPITRIPMPWISFCNVLFMCENPRLLLPQVCTSLRSRRARTSQIILNSRHVC